MGHEFGGEVVAVGSDAGSSGWREACTTVAVLPVVSCGSCGLCSGGDVAHCSSVRFIGMGRDAGGFAELVVVPARHAFGIPNELLLTHGGACGALCRRSAQRGQLPRSVLATTS